jgi:peptidyl-dipeptidase A
MVTLRTPAVEAAFQVALDDWENQLDEVEVAYADAQWRRHFDFSAGDDLSQLETERSKLLLGARMREVLRHWESRPRDPLLARRVELLLRRLRWAEVESQPQVFRLRNRIDQALLNFRPQIASVTSSRVDRSEILRRHPDRDRRREAWFAMAPLTTQIEADVRRLMRRRQELAQAQGYDGFVSWALGAVGLDRAWVDAFFVKLRQLTEAPYQAWLVEAAQRLKLVDGLRPWDLPFVAEQEMSLPEIAFPSDRALPAVRAVAEGLGLGEAFAGVQVAVADIPHAALCYAVRPPDDVRVVISPRDGRVHYDVLFHEFGHALHWRSLRPPSPVLRRESPPFNEGMACLWARLVSEPEWLLKWGNIGSVQAVSYRRAWVKRAIYRLRVRMAQATFEYRAYDALDGDLSALYRGVLSEYLGVPFDQAPGWADSPFWTSHPVYFQNYVIGEAMASQILVTLRQLFNRLIGEPRLGAWLTEHFYVPGAALSWATKISRATGSPLNTNGLATDLNLTGSVSGIV